MLQFHNRKTYRRLKRGILIGALMLAISGAGVLGMNHTSYVHAQTKGVWSQEYDEDEDKDVYLYTDENGWVFSMDSKTSQDCLLKSVPADTSGELIIPSKMHLDSIVRTVSLSYHFKIPGEVTRVCMPKDSDYSPYWFNFGSETKDNITVCYYEGDNVADYLNDNDFKTEILDPASAEVIGGEEADNWTYDMEQEQFIYTTENGMAYGLVDKDSDVCSLHAISNDATGEIAISSKVMIEGKARTLEWIDDECKIPAGITKVTFTESSIYFRKTLLEQCSSDLIVAFPLADCYGKSSEYSNDMYWRAKEKGLKMEFLNGMQDKNGVIYYIENASAEKASAGVFACEEKGTNIIVSSKVTINGTVYPVTRIAMSAFSGNQKVKKVTLPNSISVISGYAFTNCMSLTSINLPSNLVEFNGSGIFNNCSSLTSIKIPSKVKYLPTGLFEKCEKLKKVELPKKIDIGDDVFSECKALSTIVNFDKVTSIGAYTFYDCKKLPSSLIFSNVQRIGETAFGKCTSLKSVTINSKSIGNLGESTFEGAKNLKSITIKATNLSAKNMGANIFKGTHKKLVVKVPAKKVSAYKKLFKKYGNKTITVKKI